MPTSAPERPATPTLDKLQAPHHGGWTRREGEPCRLIDHSNLIGQFLEWAQAHGLTLAKYAPESEVEAVDGGFFEARDILVPDGRSIDRLLHDYFEIDADEEEREKRALLDYVRAGGTE